jgi:hypothetical protein
MTDYRSQSGRLLMNGELVAECLGVHAKRSEPGYAARESVSVRVSRVVFRSDFLPGRRDALKAEFTLEGCDAPTGETLFSFSNLRYRQGRTLISANTRIASDVDFETSNFFDAPPQEGQEGASREF